MRRLSASIRRLFGTALDWDGGDAVDPAAMAVTALGMGVPILLGVLIGRPTIGLAASVGAMWVGNAPRGSSFGEHWRILRDVVLAALAAAIVAVTIAQRGLWSDVLLILVASIAALTGGFSRPMAVASQRFIVFATIGLGVAAHTQNRAALAVIIGEGAIWTAACALAIGVVARRWKNITVAQTEPASTASFAAKFRRWLGTLRTGAGWNYAVRLAVCLGIAAAIREAFLKHHFSWIVVAVALLTQRQGEGLMLKVAQRALGVAAGVLASALIAFPLPGWALVAIIATLAAASPWLRNRSYLAYTAATTPLIILLTSGGAAIGQGLLLDRLIATLLAAALVIGAYLAIRPRPAPENPRSG